MPGVGKPDLVHADHRTHLTSAMHSSTDPGPAHTARPSTVLCIAAASIESITINRLFTEAFGEGRQHLVAGTERYVNQYVGSDAHPTWYVYSPSFQGETEAAVAVADLVRFLPTDVVLMVGMCMGLPGADLATGTVIVPNEIVVLDHRRLTSTGTKTRLHFDRVDNRLHSLARSVAHTRTFEFDVVTDKGLATGSTKIEDRDADVVKDIEALGDVIAYDMEGWGFYRAAEATRCLWIKAVADRGEAQAPGPEGRKTKQEVQASVTRNAAIFAMIVVDAYCEVGAVASNPVSTSEPASAPKPLRLGLRCNGTDLPLHADFPVVVGDEADLAAMRSRLSLGLDMTVAVTIVDDADYGAMDLSEVGWRVEDVIESAAKFVAQRRGTLEKKINRFLTVASENYDGPFVAAALDRAIALMCSRMGEEEAGAIWIDVFEPADHAVLFKARVPVAWLDRAAAAMDIDRPVRLQHGADLYWFQPSEIVGRIIPYFVLYQQWKPETLTGFVVSRWHWGET